MEKEYLKTSDLDLAATLLALGFPIDGIYTRPGGRIYDFYFIKSAQVEQTMKDYWARNLRVEPLMLLSSRKEIITRMKEGGDETGT